MHSQSKSQNVTMASNAKVVCLVILAILSASEALPFFNATGVNEAVAFADKTWNCAGNAPPCGGCSTVPAGSAQDPYGCAPYVAHCLAAGGFVPRGQCGSISDFENVQFGGKSYSLNVVSRHDPNCGGGLCLMDYLVARGWTEVNRVRAGTVIAVQGEDGSKKVPWGHIVFGVGNGIVNAHNMAHYHVPITNYVVEQMLDPPASQE